MPQKGEHVDLPKLAYNNHMDTNVAKHFIWANQILWSNYLTWGYYQNFSYIFLKCFGAPNKFK